MNGKSSSRGQLRKTYAGWESENDKRPGKLLCDCRQGIRRN